MLLSKENSCILTTNAEYGAKDASAYMLLRIERGRDATLDVPVPFWYRSSLGNDLNPAVRADDGGDRVGGGEKDRREKENLSLLALR